MKKVFAVLAIAVVLAVGALTVAHQAEQPPVWPTSVVAENPPIWPSSLQA